LLLKEDTGTYVFQLQSYRTQQQQQQQQNNTNTARVDISHMPDC
jgi:hypothetical protein